MLNDFIIFNFLFFFFLLLIFFKIWNYVLLLVIVEVLWIILYYIFIELSLCQSVVSIVYFSVFILVISAIELLVNIIIAHCSYLNFNNMSLRDKFNKINIFINRKKKV